MEVNWDTCGLSVSLRDAIKKFGFTQMTPVQVATIPVFMKNKDVCVEAVTGSGKTLAFLIPLLEILLRRTDKLKKHQIGGLIISPTRELASQIYDVLKSFIDSKNTSFSTSLVIGGRGEIEKEYRRLHLSGSNILVGTPGRISALLQQFPILKISLQALEVLVLDEADRLLDLGFEAEIMSILSYLPKQRRTGLFSATQTHEVDLLIRAGMRNPVKITVAEKKETFAAAYTTCNIKTPSSLNNLYTVCSLTSKFNLLVDIVMSRKSEKILIFFATCACVDYFGEALKEFLGTDVNLLLIHGKMRKKRLGIFNKFRQMNQGILACTDVMARGIDIPDVNWVLQFDPPSNASAFVHRCGRTARVGKKGEAILFLLENETSYVDFIEINQKAPLIEYKIDDKQNNIDWLDKLRHLATNDRSLMERGIRAFVSFVQSYSKHECSLIFRLKDLNLGQLATGFALLKLPRMPELRNKSSSDFYEVNVDISSIPYRDEVRERQRLACQTNSENVSKRKFVPKKFKSWSQTKKLKEMKKEKRQKRQKRKLAKKSEKSETNNNEIDEAELENDFKIVKDLKRRKITSKDYESCLQEEEKRLFGKSI